ncbi:MAG: aldehyde dehydrogenase family protein [Akkermansiaceae bacterium]|nr:aldehyde dehydrogenase family protein [Akkermansiaceae bacterium]
MGDLNISALLKEAKDRRWDDRTVAQRSADLAEKLRDEAVKKLSSDERTVLAALSKLTTDGKNRNFLKSLIENVLQGNNDAVQCDNLRKLLAEFGGIPTIFSTMARLRFKAATMAPRLMQNAAINEIRRIFRSTFSELTLPIQMEKVDKKVRDFAKDKIGLALSPLSPTVFGNKTADLYKQNLERIQSRQNGVGLSIQPWRLCPQISLYAPDDGAEHVAQKLSAIIKLSMSGGLAAPLIIETGTSEQLPVIVDGFMRAMRHKDFYRANIMLELPAYLQQAPEILRRLTEWASDRLSNGAQPLKVLIVKGSHLDAERLCAFKYGAEHSAAATKAATDARFKQLVHTAISTDLKAICPVIGTHHPFDICYSLLDWGRCGRPGLPHFVFRAGLGNHLARVLAKEGANVTLTAGLESEKSETGDFEGYLAELINELSRPDGYLTNGYAPESDSMGWTRMRQQYLASLSGREEVPADPPKAISGFIPGTLGHLTNPVHTAAFYAAAEAAREQQPCHIPLYINGKETTTPLTCIRRSLTVHGMEDYRFTGADYDSVNTVLALAEHAAAHPATTTEQERLTQLHRLAKELQNNRAELAAILVKDAGFTYQDAEHEILCATEACYYFDLCAEQDGMKDGTAASPLGVIVVAPGGVHPLADAIYGIAAAIITGNCIIYKPAASNVLLGSKLNKIAEKIGFRSPHFQFIPCPDNEIALKLLTGACVKGIISGGGAYKTSDIQEKAPTAKVCHRHNGFATVYLSASGNWQQLVQDIAESAFRRSGQCPTCPHVLLVHAGTYDNQLFINSLKDAVSSLRAEPGWRQGANLGPLAAPLSKEELNHLQYPASGETWLLKPEAPEPDSLLYTPGIRTGVQVGSPLLRSIHKLPVLALMRVESADEAFALQRRFNTGSAAIIYSQNEEEIAAWQQALADATNLGINCCPNNRPAILPYGFAAPYQNAHRILPGSANYLIHLRRWKENARPQRRGKQRNIAFAPWEIVTLKLTPDETMRLTTAADSLSYWWENEFGISHRLSPDPAEQTTLHYLPCRICLRAETETPDTELSIALMAALKAGCDIRLSTANIRPWMTRSLEGLGVQVHLESRSDYLKQLPRLAAEAIPVRDPAATDEEMAVAAACGLSLNREPILGNGRIELLHYLREQYITRRV